MAEDQTRVVLVDDSVDVRQLLRYALDREADFTVVAEAGDGATGVALATEHQPDLVLLDVAMPEMDGIEAVSLIREHSPDSMVIILSAFTGFSDATAQCLALGAHGYIEKGGGLAKMTRQLREALGRAPADES